MNSGEIDVTDHFEGHQRVVMVVHDDDTVSFTFREGNSWFIVQARIDKLYNLQNIARVEQTKLMQRSKC